MGYVCGSGVRVTVAIAADSVIIRRHSDSDSDGIPMVRELMVAVGPLMRNPGVGVLMEISKSQYLYCHSGCLCCVGSVVSISALLFAIGECILRQGEGGNTPSASAPAPPETCAAIRRWGCAFGQRMYSPETASLARPASCVFLRAIITADVYHPNSPLLRCTPAPEYLRRQRRKHPIMPCLVLP